MINQNSLLNRDLNMLSQKEAVYKATIEVLDQANMSLGSKSAAETVPKELRKLIASKIVTWISNGEVSFKKTVSNSMMLKDHSKISTYVSGLISNHWKRDSRLNGSTSK